MMIVDSQLCFLKCGAGSRRKMLFFTSPPLYEYQEEDGNGEVVVAAVVVECDAMDVAQERMKSKKQVNARDYKSAAFVLTKGAVEN
jgi:hypothetical protein